MVSVGSLVLVCYFTNWAQYRSGGDGSGKVNTRFSRIHINRILYMLFQKQFTPDNIDPNLCTHINYAFANLAKGVLTQFEWNDDVNYAKVIALKKQNPSLDRKSVV